VECFFSVEGIGGPYSRLKLLEDTLRSRTPVLVKYVDMKAENELQALLALQKLMVRYVNLIRLHNMVVDPDRIRVQ
jgi:hypothetical protein